MLRKEFLDKKIILHCPGLDAEGKYLLEDYQVHYEIKLWSIKGKLMDQYLVEAVARADDIRMLMKDPGHWQRLLQGHLSHGYDLQSHKSLQGLVIWDVEVKVEDFQDRGNPKDQGLARLLIPLALRNSVSGMLSIKQIASFFTRHFRTCSVENLASISDSVCTPSRGSIRRVLWQLAYGMRNGGAGEQVSREGGTNGRGSECDGHPMS